MKTIVTVIPINVATNLLLPTFRPYKTKIRIWFSASWWSGHEKYFCFLLIASRALLQSHAEFNRLYKGTFLYVISVRIIFPCLHQSRFYIF